MSETFTYKCPFCGADVVVSKDPIPETAICDTCKKEFPILRETFYAGEVFAGEF